MLTRTAAAGARARRRESTRTRDIRTALEQRLAELRAEHDEAVADLAGEDGGLMVVDAGDDLADIGTKTFTREQELSVVNVMRDRMAQVEHALERLADGRYGHCEGCGESIPAARLAAFPAATLCVACKQRQERG